MSFCFSGKKLQEVLFTCYPGESANLIICWIFIGQKSLLRWSRAQNTGDLANGRHLPDDAHGVAAERADGRIGHDH